MKTPHEIVVFEFESDIHKMADEILRLRAEKTTYPIPGPTTLFPNLPQYPGDYPIIITCKVNCDD